MVRPISLRSSSSMCFSSTPRISRIRLRARVQTHARLLSVARGQAGMLELPSALDQDDLGDDGEGDLAGGFVSEPQADGGVQPVVLARIAPAPPRDVAEDERDLAAAADQTQVSRPGSQRGLEHRLVDVVATGHDHHEVGRPRQDTAEWVSNKIAAPDFFRVGKPLTAGKLLAIVD